MRPLAVALLLLPTVAAADDKAAELHPWARWKPGTSIKLTSGPPDDKATFVYTLKSIIAASYELEHTIRSKEIRAAAPKVELHGRGELAPITAPSAVMLGDEAIRVGNKDLRCTNYRWSGNIGPNHTVDITECRAAGIAIPLKRTVRSNLYGTSVVETYVATRLDEPVRAAGRSFQAVRLEGTDLVAGKTIHVTRWESLEVPGGLIKSTRSRDGVVFATSEVVEITVVK